MRKPLIVEFTKMDGAGNDFIVIDNRFYSFSSQELSALAHRFCNRSTGIGGDGLLALSPAESAEQDFRMRYYNADGSLGTMCGNGARCLVAFARESGIPGTDLRFGSDAGLMRASFTGEAGRSGEFDVEVILPAPSGFSRDRLPVPDLSVAIRPLGFVWTGTEHAVYEVSALDTFPVGLVGPAIRNHPSLSPAGANVNFVERISSGDAEARVRARTYEKGVEAETRACGTGAIAVAFCGREFGWWGPGTVHVEMPGGTLRVGLPSSQDEDGRVTLAGPARVAFRGSVEVDPEDLAQE